MLGHGGGAPRHHKDRRRRFLDDSRRRYAVARLQPGAIIDRRFHEPSRLPEIGLSFALQRSFRAAAARGQ